MVALGEGGLYTEDSPAVKPISELTVHKLYYPVYPDQRSSLSARTMAPPSVTDPNGRKDDDDDDDDAMDVYHCDG